MLPGGVPGNLGSGATVCHMLAKRGSKAGGESRSDRLLGPEGGGGAHRESSSSVGGERLEREGVVGAFHKSASTRSHRCLRAENRYNKHAASILLQL